MKYYGKNIICKDYKGNEVNRPNKVAVQYSRKRSKNGGIPSGNLLTLAIKGTLDVLAKTRFDIVKVTLKHPTEFGYFKTSYVLKKNKHKFNLA